MIVVWVTPRPFQTLEEGGWASVRPRGSRVARMQPSCQSCCDASDAAYAGLWHLKPCAVSGICISKNEKKILARRFPVLPDGCCPLVCACASA